MMGKSKVTFDVTPSSGAEKALDDSGEKSPESIHAVDREIHFDNGDDCTSDEDMPVKRSSSMDVSRWVPEERSSSMDVSQWVPEERTFSGIESDSTWSSMDGTRPSIDSLFIGKKPSMDSRKSSIDSTGSTESESPKPKKLFFLPNGFDCLVKDMNDSESDEEVILEVPAPISNDIYKDIDIDNDKATAEAPKKGTPKTRLSKRSFLKQRLIEEEQLREQLATEQQPPDHLGAEEKLPKAQEQEQHRKEREQHARDQKIVFQEIKKYDVQTDEYDPRDQKYVIPAVSKEAAARTDSTETGATKTDATGTDLTGNRWANYEPPTPEEVEIIMSQMRERRTRMKW